MSALTAHGVPAIRITCRTGSRARPISRPCMSAYEQAFSLVSAAVMLTRSTALQSLPGPSFANLLGYGRRRSISSRCLVLKHQALPPPHVSGSFPASVRHPCRPVARRRVRGPPRVLGSCPHRWARLRGHRGRLSSAAQSPILQLEPPTRHGRTQCPVRKFHPCQH
jgi:hypothetical protein